jgi:nucleoside-diphosphate-sugar epimerase
MSDKPVSKILITGGAGYLGSVMVGHLLRRGHSVTVIDNLMHGQTGLFQYCQHPAFDFVRGDARDEALMARMIPGHDVLIPLAALVGMPICDRDPVAAKTVNYEAIVLMNRLRAKSQRVVYPCTNSGYGTKTGNVHCTEETPLEPISLYGTTKVDAEKVLLDSPNTVTLRLATVFGVSSRLRMDLLVNDFTYRAMRDRALVLYEGHFQRNFVHIDDVGEAFCFVIDHFEEMAGQPYNLGLDSANISKHDLAVLLRKFVPSLLIHESDLGSDPDKRNYIVSNERLRKKGFEARRSLEQGIEELMKAYRMLPVGAYGNV